MEHFVSIITRSHNLGEHLIEKVLNSASVALLEDETQYQIFETVSREKVLRVGLHRELSEQEADEFAESLADKLFEMGFDDFDIEVSATESEDLPFDIVEDIFVFMKNDPMFYRRNYFPTMAKISDEVKTKKKVNFNNHIEPMIDKGFDLYCKKFKIPKPDQKHFTDERKSDLRQRIREEEIPLIRKGEY